MHKRITPWLRFFFYLALLACLAGLIVQPAFAYLQSFIGNSFNITPNTDSSLQMAPALAYNPGQNQWLVAWEDNRTGSTEGIYAQRVDPQGNLQGGLITVSDTADELHRPAVAFDYTQLRYLVVWENDSNFNIEGRVINANGTSYSGVITIWDSSHHSTSHLDVAYNPITDEYLVVWDYEAFGGHRDIRGIKVGVDGVPDPGGDFAIANNGYDEQTPALVVNPTNGNYLVVFSRHDTTNDNIGGQRLWSNATKSGSVLVISNDPGNELSPDVIFNTADGWTFVTWHHDVAVGTTEVKGRIVRADNSMGGQPTISAEGGNDESFPSITSAPSCDPYLVTWQDGWDVYGRWISSTGAVASDIFTITGANTAYNPAVAFGSDRYLVTYNQEVSHYDIFGRFGTANPQIWLPVILN